MPSTTTLLTCLLAVSASVSAVHSSRSSHSTTATTFTTITTTHSSHTSHTSHAAFSSSSSSSGSCSVQSGVQQTFYGYPDNSPPGAGIAYTQCGRSQAGGTGTYDDPLTMATASGELNVCEVVYAPYLKKYLRYEDECAECNSDWKNGNKWHIDTWTGSSTVNGGQKQIDCEDSLTPDAAQSIIRNPSKDLPVDSMYILDNFDREFALMLTNFPLSSHRPLLQRLLPDKSHLPVVRRWHVLQLLSRV
ncbi:hypothetical protein VTN96DRAFT_7209 [Rasamsonia emersonii]